ncbi:MAG: IS66 family transposase [Patescibacteria group bacterium]|nr:IS66 family transposase [Patescibacteria group bacterium]
MKKYKTDKIRRQNQKLQHKNKTLKDKNQQLKEQLEEQKEQLEEQKGQLTEQKEKLEEKIRDLEIQLNEYRQMLFKKKAVKDVFDQENNKKKVLKKKGAPVGHPGTTRKIPKRVDIHKDIHVYECPHCQGNNLSQCNRYEDHYQEDIVIPRTQVTRFRHYYYYCRDCKKTAFGVAKGELLGSYLGPNVKSLGAFLHYDMSLPYRKIRVLFNECFNLDIEHSTLVGFDKQLRIRGQPLYERLKGELKNKPYLHIDETGWKDDWLWCYASKGAIVYTIEEGRGQKQLKDILGKRYSGVLISDFLSAYNKIICRKQRCLVHLLRLIKKRLLYFNNDRKLVKYFSRLKVLIKRIIALDKKLAEKIPRNFSVLKADVIGQLRRLLKQNLSHSKAEKFRMKLQKQFKELITCLDFVEVCSHNNWAERLLRPNVIMRKITFGNRSESGKMNHQVLMSLLQTARQHNLNPLSFYRSLFADPSQAAASIAL